MVSCVKMLHTRYPDAYEQQVFPTKEKHPDPSDPTPWMEIVGVFRSKGGFAWEQTAPGISIHFIQGGAGIFETDGKEHYVEAGDIYLFWPCQHIRYWDLPGKPWRYTWMFMAGNEQSWIFKKAGLDRSISHLQIPNISRFSRTLEQIVATYAEGSYSALYPAWSVIELLDALHACSLGGGSSDGHIGDRLRQLVDSSPTASPSVQELAGTLEIDRSTAYRAFRCRYGLSIKEYIEENRMDKAQSLRLYSPSSIKEIAWMLGYADVRQFSKAFRKRLGTSPSEWRIEHVANSSTLCSTETDFS